MLRATGVLCALFCILAQGRSQVHYTRYCHLECKEKNTVCKRPSCKMDDKCTMPSGQIPLSEYDRTLMYTQHNNYRSKVASGRDGFQPASDMQAISYNLELEYSAQCWANACELHLDLCRSTPNFTHVSQILYISNRTHVAHLQMFLKEAMHTWFRQAKRLTTFKIQHYQLVPNITGGSQIIWADTTNFGCGRSRFGNWALLVCNYAPMGNVLSHSVYEIGIPCKVCTCHPVYTSLCGDSSIMGEGEWLAPHGYENYQINHAINYLEIMFLLMVQCLK